MTGLSQQTVLSDLEEIGHCSPGCRYWRVDLHTHTPASGDARWPEGTTPHDIVAAYAAKGVSLIAVTDHSTGDWVDDLKDAGRKLSKRHKIPFTVLPGVELNVGGIHIAVVFPESVTTRAITLFLGRLDLRGALGEEGTFTDNTISTVAREAGNEGGILVGCHCNSSKGVVKALKGKPRTTALDSLDLLEICADQATTKADKTITYVQKTMGFKDMPFIFCSDAHAEDEIAEQVSLLKMDSPCFAGIRQLLFEPSLRTLGTGHPQPEHTRFLGVIIDGGLYHDTAIQFSPNLNVIIGGRGAGKSALIDLLRFVLGFQAVASGFQRQVDQRLGDFLKDGDEIRLYVECAGERFCVRHRMESKRLRDKLELVSQPEVYRLRQVGPLHEAFDPADFLAVDIYGQGEVLDLTRKADDQLALIDTFTDLTEVEEGIEAQLDLIKANSEECFALSEERENLAEEVDAKDQVKARIAELEEHLQDSVFKEHDSWESEKLFVDSVSTAVDNLESLSSENPYRGIEVLQLPTDDQYSLELPAMVKAYNSLLDRLQGLVDEEISIFAEDRSKIDILIDTWKERYGAARRRLEEKLKALGLQDVKHAYEERNSLKGRLREIEEECEPELAKLDERATNLNAARDIALTELGRLCRMRSALRQKAAQSLNAQLSDNICVDVEPRGNDDAYFDLLDSDIYAGSGIRNRAQSMEVLVDSFSPPELAALIRSRDEQVLRKVGLTDNTTTKVLSIPEIDIRRIEEALLEDWPVISLRREGEKDYAPLDKLSLGEKCSAILSIVLMGEDRPLVLDEPEAELDHEFICNSVVESIRDVKGHRQIIVCTHNPNIPVLGDAELIIKVSKVVGEPHCRVDHTGGLEHAVSLHYLKQLEGGEEALRRRSAKYQLA